MRRLAAISLAVLIAVALVWPATGVAETEAALRAKLQSLKSEAAAAGKDFSSAYWRLDETEVRLARTNKQLKKTNKKLAAARKQLNGRANNIYRRDRTELVGFLVGAASFEEFVTRAEYLQRIGTADARALAQVKRLKREQLQERSRLKAQRTQQASRVKELRRRRDKLNARLRSVETRYRAVKRRLDAVRSGGRLPSGVRAAPGPNGMVFPVAGANYYSNTWGASRSGGRRRHQGTDIMARSGTPVVAILPGTVRSKSGGLGGRVIWLRADNGWLFYYAHLRSWTVRSGRVRAGQVIGTVGATGNAAGGAPHLHFQMHPGGGGPVNPYAYLRAME